MPNKAKTDVQSPSGSRIRSWWHGDMADRPLAASLPALTAWFSEGCGREILDSEQQLLDDILPALFGYHLLEMSVSSSARLSARSPIHHRAVLAPALTPPGESSPTLVADADSLPFDSDSVDVVILHHVLDFSPHPHQVLREVNRVLIPRGHVVIVGFNPVSLFGLWKALGSLFTRSGQWRYGSLTRGRLLDWFKLLDLDKAGVYHTFYRPPGGAWLRDRLAFLDRLGHRFGLPVGGVYVLVARKDVGAVTPLRAPWEKHPVRLFGIAGAARPSVRGLGPDAAARTPRQPPSPRH